MNLYYAKVALYAYSNLESIMEQIDELVEKKALASMSNLTPCEEQCNQILDLTSQKDVLIDLKITLDKIFKKFTPVELDLLDYKYFRIKSKEYFFSMDTKSREYFRKQVRIAKKFANFLEKSGYNDDKFLKVVFKIDFFKELLKRVIEKEMLNNKNKPKAKKPTETLKKEYRLKLNKTA